MAFLNRLRLMNHRMTSHELPTTITLEAKTKYQRPSRANRSKAMTNMTTLTTIKTFTVLLKQTTKRDSSIGSRQGSRILTNTIQTTEVIKTNLMVRADL